MEIAFKSPSQLPLNCVANTGLKADNSFRCDLITLGLLKVSLVANMKQQSVESGAQKVSTNFVNLSSLKLLLGMLDDDLGVSPLVATIILIV